MAIVESCQITGRGRAKQVQGAWGILAAFDDSSMPMTATKSGSPAPADSVATENIATVKATAKAKAGRPPGSSKELTLARILPVARKLFAEKGYAQTTFKELGKAMGMSHAAFYQYFSSKTDLYIATFIDTQAVLLPHYLSAIAEGKTLKERITGVLLASAEAHDADSTITGFLAAVPIEMMRHAELYDLLRQQNNEVMVALEAMFEEAKASGEICSTASAQHLVQAFLGGGVGVSLFQYATQEPALRAAMDVFVDLINGKIFSAGS